MSPSLEALSIDAKKQWSHKQPSTDLSREYAQKLDDEDPLRLFRNYFIIPSRGGIKKKSLREKIEGPDTESAVYLCGNSLGLQPHRTCRYVQNYLETWASKAVTGHFTAYEDSLTPAWIDMDDAAAKGMAKIVGAKQDEVAVMDTLTGNLHLLMASFYRPTKERYKIIIEEKAFPSDHYAIESQIRHHNLSPSDALVLVSAPNSASPYLPLSHIYSIISEHASSTAVLLLPGIQYYSGQLFDMKAITAFAQARGITVGWDLAHAAGNVPLQLHDWNVDFAVWCTYKYINAGAGATGGMFVHKRHGTVDLDSITRNGSRSISQELEKQQQETDPSAHHPEPTLNGTSKPPHLPSKSQPSQTPFRHRLAGWWGGDKSTRFNMAPTFIPRPGAAGFQLSNPSALDMTSVLATLSVFDETNMTALRQKSVALTAYLEELLLSVDINQSSDESFSLSSPNGKVTNDGTDIAEQDSHDGDNNVHDDKLPYQIITPRDPAERGAQLSIRLAPGLLDTVMSVLKEEGVVVDERKPDVVRVAPAPLYNSYMDVWWFVGVFGGACAIAMREKKKRERKGERKES